MVAGAWGMIPKATLWPPNAHTGMDIAHVHICACAHTSVTIFKCMKKTSCLTSSLAFRQAPHYHRQSFYIGIYRKHHIWCRWLLTQNSPFFLWCSSYLWVSTLPSYDNHKNNIHQNIADLWTLHLHCNLEGSLFSSSSPERCRKQDKKNPGTQSRAL